MKTETTTEAPATETEVVDEAKPVGWSPGHNNDRASKNMSLEGLTAMLRGKSASSSASQKPPAEAPKPAKATASAEPKRNDEPATGAAAREETKTSETEPAPGEGAAETTTSDEGEETETEADAGSEADAKELHPELKAAIEEAKAAGFKGIGKQLKRISRLTDLRDVERMGRLQAEQRATQLETQLAESRKGAPAAPSAGRDRYASDPKIRDLDAELANTEQLLEWADANEDGATVPEGNGTREMTPQEVRKYRRAAEAKRTELLGKRAVITGRMDSEHAVASRQADAVAFEIYPNLNKPGTPEHETAQQVFERYPDIANDPGRHLIVAHYIRGLLAWQADCAKQGKKAELAPMTKPKGGTEPTKLPGSPAAAAPRINAPQAELAAAEAKWKKSGRIADYQKWLALNQTARKKAA